jgi:protein TonB
MVDHRRVLVPSYGHLPQRRTPAWAVSVAVHVTLLGVLLWLMQHTVTAPPPEPARMVFVEPAPPPPPPLGAPADAPVAEPVVQQPKEIPKPRRLVVPRKKAKVMPTPVQVPVAIPNGVPEGSAGGVAGGVVGGEAGGTVGGVVGGHGDAIPADRVEHPPIVVARVLPEYPPMARARSLEGRVVLRAVVDRTGHVEEAITVVESSPPFDTAAVGALRRWRFQPGRDRDGRPVRVLIDVPIRFQLR